MNKKISNLYNQWHNSKHHSAVHWGILIIVVFITWTLISGWIGAWVHVFLAPGTDIRLSRANAQLLLSPQTKVVKVGETFSLNIILDTGRDKVDGVDIYSLHYDPSLLQLTDADPGKPGVQITPGSILDINTYNLSDPTSGNIKFAQVSRGGTSFSGKGILATATFRALAPGTAYLNFDFTKGSTIDSNAAYRGKDLLDKVVDGIYTIEP